MRIVFLVFFILLGVNSFGQKWKKNYDEIIPTKNGLYIVYKFYEKEFEFKIATRDSNKKRDTIYTTSCVFDKRYGLVNSKGKVILPTEYLSMKENDEGFITFSKRQEGNKKFMRLQLYDHKSLNHTRINKYYMPCIKEKKNTTSSNEGVSVLSLLIKKHGIDIGTEAEFYIKEDFNRVEGLCNKNGKIIMPIGKYKIFDSRYDENGLLKVIDKNDKVGYIDGDGKIIVPVIYDAYFFLKDKILVGLNGKYAFFDRKGNEIFPFKYQYIWPAEIFPNIYYVERDGEAFFLDFNSKEEIAKLPLLQYYHIAGINENIMEVTDFNLNKGWIDKSGKEIIPMKFSSINFVGENIEAEKSDTKIKVLFDKTGKCIENCEELND